MLKSHIKDMKSAGMRATRQRALILDIMHQGHLDADEIYLQTRDKDPRISLSTVYRALQKFKDTGLVTELHYDENHHHYEVKPTAEHHHLLCVNCGKVIEFQHPLKRHIQKAVSAIEDFEITGAEVRAMGYCGECRRRQKNREEVDKFA